MRIAAEHQRRPQDDIAHAACRERPVGPPLGVEKGQVAAGSPCVRRDLDDQQFPVARSLIESEHRLFLGGRQVIGEPVLQRAGAIDHRLLAIQCGLPVHTPRHAGEVGLQPAHLRHLQRRARRLASKPSDLVAFLRKSSCDGGPDEAGRTENQDVHAGTLAETTSAETRSGGTHPGHDRHRRRRRQTGGVKA